MTNTKTEIRNALNRIAAEHGPAAAVAALGNLLAAKMERQGADATTTEEQIAAFVSGCLANL